MVTEVIQEHEQLSLRQAYQYFNVGTSAYCCRTKLRQEDVRYYDMLVELTETGHKYFSQEFFSVQLNEVCQLHQIILFHLTCSYSKHFETTHNTTPFADDVPLMRSHI